MATFYADSALDQPARSDTAPITVPFRFNTASLTYGTNGNIIVLAKIPKFATVTGFELNLPILDSANTGRLGIGTLSNATRFTESVNMGAAIRVSSFDSTVTANTHVGAASIPYRVLNTTAGAQTVEDDLRLTLSNAVTTAVANAVVSGFVQYNCLEPQSSIETRPTS